MEGWSGLLERIHWPPPLSENLIVHDSTGTLDDRGQEI
jgi:hypothetical protein